MSLKIELQQPSGPQAWYSTGDTISGKVLLNLQRTLGVSNISVSLGGVCFTHVSKMRDSAQRIEDNAFEYLHVLDERKTVFPKEGMDTTNSVSYTIAAGRHEFPFEFQIPLYSMPTGDVGALPRAAMVLPPSLSDMTEDVMVQYFIKVKMAKSGALFTGGTAYQFFVFLPADIQKDDTAGTTCRTIASGGVTSSKLDPLGLWSKLSRISRAPSSKSERQNSCKAVNFTLQCDRVLTPTIKFEPLISVSLTNPMSVTIQSIEIELHVVTKAKAKNLKREYEQRILLLQRQKLEINLSEKDDGIELTDKNDGISLGERLEGGLSILIPSHIGPSFRVPLITRNYFVVAKIKYTHRPGVSSIHRVVLKNPVQIKSGVSLPHWETGQVERIDRPFEQKKDYFHKRASWLPPPEI